MQVYTFRAGSLPEALAQVRRTLGPDATVLPEPRWTGLGPAGSGSGWVEVRALPPDDNLPAGQPPSPWVRHRHAYSALPAQAGLAPSIGPSSPLPAAELEDYRLKLRRDLVRAEDEPSLVEQLADAEAAEEMITRYRTTLARRLTDAGIDPATCQRWLDRWQQQWVWQPTQPAPLDGIASPGRTQHRGASADEAALQSVLREVIAGELPIAGPVELGISAPQVVVLAGPTGVGKTTTIAKLAARFCRQQACRVGLVAADHYRLAAVEQLRAYAQIMDLPLEVAESPAAVVAARQRLSSCDLVLVDTAGVSPRDTDRLAELAALREAASPCELALVLSAAAHPHVLSETAEVFQRLGATRLVLTKLDEAVACGPLLDWLGRCPLPLSYTTSGQNVHLDLEVAAAHPLATHLLQRALASADPAGREGHSVHQRALPDEKAATRPPSLVAAFPDP